MTVHVFFNPDLVGQLAACGITARRPSGAVGATGFVLEGRRAPARAREAVTPTIAVRGNVTITGPRPSIDQPSQRALPASTASEPRTALELVEECDRLRRDNQRLTDEVSRLRAQVDRLTAGPIAPRADGSDLDDSARRFALLELDL